MNRSFIGMRRYSILSLELSWRAKNTLCELLLKKPYTELKFKNLTLGDIYDKATIPALLSIHGCGKATVAEIRRKLKPFKLSPMEDCDPRLSKMTSPSPLLLDTIAKGSYFFGRRADAHVFKHGVLFAYSKEGDYCQLVEGINGCFFKKISRQSIGEVVAICEIPSSALL